MLGEVKLSRREWRGRPRNAENRGLPKGVYRRVRNGVERFYDAEGRALTRERLVELNLPLPPRRPEPVKLNFAALTRGMQKDEDFISETFRLASRDELVRKAVPVTPKVGVYFLVKDKEIVYVGRSADIMRRLIDHRRIGKEFDSVSWVECCEADAARLEIAYIAALDPPLNRQSISLYKLMDLDRN